MVLQFRFVYALTLMHVLTTLVGLRLFAAMGFYEKRPLPIRPLLLLCASFVGYIVFWNLSLQVANLLPVTPNPVLCHLRSLAVLLTEKPLWFPSVCT